jgi:hypothetical protein
VGPSEIISAHVVHGLDVSDDRFDRGIAAQVAFDGVSDAASLAGDVDLERNHRRPMEPLRETPSPVPQTTTRVGRLTVPYVSNPDIALTVRRATGRITGPGCEHVSLRLDLIGGCAVIDCLRTYASDDGRGP